MAFTDDDKIVIKFLRQNKHYGAKRFISEFPEKRWSLKRFTDAASRTWVNYGNASSLHGMNSISASSILQSVSGELVSMCLRRSKLWVDISNTNCDLLYQISCTYIIVKYRDITQTLYLTIDSQLVGGRFFWITVYICGTIINWPAQLLFLGCTFVYLSVTKPVNTMFWKELNRFWCYLEQMIHAAEAWNGQLWRSGGQRSRSHEAKIGRKNAFWCEFADCLMNPGGPYYVRCRLCNSNSVGQRNVRPNWDCRGIVVHPLGLGSSEWVSSRVVY